MSWQHLQDLLNNPDSPDRTSLIVALLLLLFIVFRCWVWAKRVFGSELDPAPRPARPWLLRPSNLLFAIGIGSVLYLFLEPVGDTATFFPLRLRAAIIVLAFVVRYAENKAVAGYGETRKSNRRLGQAEAGDRTRE